MIILLALTLATVAVGVCLMAGMLGRDEPVLGMIGLMVLQAAGVLSTVYGVLSGA